MGARTPPTTRTPLRAAAATLCAALLAACGGGGVPESPTIPQDVVPGVVGQTVALDAGGVADEALRPAELAGLLEDAGFVAGAQRAFSPGLKVRRVDVRVLVFDSTDGARAYLGWLDSHASEVIGMIEARETIEVNGSAVTVFAHFPGGCCPHEMPVYLTAWRDGSRILSVKAVGPDVNLMRVQDLAVAVDGAV